MMRHSSFTFTYLLLSMLLLFSACEGKDDRSAVSTSPKRAVFYDFFNDIRLEVAALEEAGEARLEGFTADTKTFLENREAQEKYKIAGFYFEKGLNREKGAYEYADRFFPNGCVIHVILYPPEQEAIWTSLQGFNKGKGKQVGQNFVFYQVFTAKPADEALENKINAIIDQKITEHAAKIGIRME